jgi:hypothetical protein
MARPRTVTGGPLAAMTPDEIAAAEALVEMAEADGE